MARARPRPAGGPGCGSARPPPPPLLLLLLLPLALLLAPAASAASSDSVAAGARPPPPPPPPLGSLLSRRGAVVWQLRLPAAECAAAAGGQAPCFNVMAVNLTDGAPLWGVASSAAMSVRSVHVGERSAVYLSAWRGPALYAVRAGTGRVRWEWPREGWFRYWRKDIDLPRAASFAAVRERGALVLAAAGGNLYALGARAGGRVWERRAGAGAGAPAGAPGAPGARVADFAGPVRLPKPADAGTVFLAVEAAAPAAAGASAGAGWAEAVSAANGALAWRSAELGALDRVAFDAPRSQVLAADAAGARLVALEATSGDVRWRREGAAPFCTSPSPLDGGAAGGSGGVLVLAGAECSGMRGLAAVNLTSGAEAWRGWDPLATRPRAGGACSAALAHGGRLLFGCDCSQPPGGAEGGGAAAAEDGVCFYSVALGTGRTAWARFSAADAAFAAGAQAAAQAPAVGRGADGGELAVFATARGVHALETADGGLVRWSWSAPAGLVVPAWHRPLVVDGSGDGRRRRRGAPAQRALRLRAGGGDDGPDGGRGAPPPPPPIVLVLAQPPADAVGAAGERLPRARLFALALDDGRLLWSARLNGTARAPLPAAVADGAAQAPAGPLLASGGLVVAQTCAEGADGGDGGGCGGGAPPLCCLRALSAGSGAARWELCVPARRGDDATHPRAQFAIWLLMLGTFASIALLLVGACALYCRAAWQDSQRDARPPGGGGGAYSRLPAGDGRAGGARAPAGDGPAGGVARADCAGWAHPIDVDSD